MTAAVITVASEVILLQSGGYPRSPVAVSYTDAEHGDGESHPFGNLSDMTDNPDKVILIDIYPFLMLIPYFIF